MKKRVLAVLLAGFSLVHAAEESPMDLESVAGLENATVSLKRTFHKTAMVRQLLQHPDLMTLNPATLRAKHELLVAMRNYCPQLCWSVLTAFEQLVFDACKGVGDETFDHYQGWLVYMSGSEQVAYALRMKAFDKVAVDLPQFVARKRAFQRAVLTKPQECARLLFDIFHRATPDSREDANYRCLEDAYYDALYDWLKADPGTVANRIISEGLLGVEATHESSIFAKQRVLNEICSIYPGESWTRLFYCFAESLVSCGCLYHQELGIKAFCQVINYDFSAEQWNTICEKAIRYCDVSNPSCLRSAAYQLVAAMVRKGESDKFSDVCETAFDEVSGASWEAAFDEETPLPAMLTFLLEVEGKGRNTKVKEFLDEKRREIREKQVPYFSKHGVAELPYLDPGTLIECLANQM